MGSPGIAVAGAVFVICMSLGGAEPPAVVSVAVEELLLGTGSDVALPIVAVLLKTVPPGVAAGIPTKMYSAVGEFGDIDASVQLTVPFVPTGGAVQTNPGAS